MKWGFLDQFRTGKQDDVRVNLLGIKRAEGDSVPTMRLDRYEAGLGDAIDLYVREITKPWWKREHLDALYLRTLREKLNGVRVQFHL
jgi:hypothetical protein